MDRLDKTYQGIGFDRSNLVLALFQLEQAQKSGWDNQGFNPINLDFWRLFIKKENRMTFSIQYLLQIWIILWQKNERVIDEKRWFTVHYCFTCAADGWRKRNGRDRRQRVWMKNSDTKSLAFIYFCRSNFSKSIKKYFLEISSYNFMWNSIV